MLMPIIVAYARRKGVNCTDTKLVYHHKNIPALSLSRIPSVLRFRGFLDILRGHSGGRREY
jgi:DNA-binding IscR family transcriptional regulator